MTQPTRLEVIAWIDREVIEAGWSADSPVNSDFLVTKVKRLLGRE